MTFAPANDNAFPTIFTDEELEAIKPTLRALVLSALEAANGDEILAGELLLGAAEVLGLEIVDPDPPKAA